MKLVIAEKPSVANTIATVLSADKKVSIIFTTTITLYLGVSVILSSLMILIHTERNLLKSRGNLRTYLLSLKSGSFQLPVQQNLNIMCLKV